VVISRNRFSTLSTGVKNSSNVLQSENRSPVQPAQELQGPITQLTPVVAMGTSLTTSALIILAMPSGRGTKEENPSDATVAVTVEPPVAATAKVYEFLPKEEYSTFRALEAPVAETSFTVTGVSDVGTIS